MASRKGNIILVLGRFAWQPHSSSPQPPRARPLLILAGAGAEVFAKLGDRVETELPARVSPGVDPYIDDPSLPTPRLAYERPVNRPWVRAGRHAIVQAFAHGRGGVVAIADHRLLDNVALAHPANERVVGLAPLLGVWTDLWSLEAVPTLEIATANAASADSPLESIFNAGLALIVGQVLLLFFAAAVWLGYPFRPLRDPPEEGRKSFAEHVHALGAHYARHDGSRRAASAYAQYLLAKRGRHAIFESARRLGATPNQAEALVHRTEQCAADPDAPASPHEDLALMEELWKIDPTR